MQKINTFVSKYFIFIVIAFSIGAVWALFVPGYFGASDDLHIAWLYEMDYLVRIWQFPPRYVPDLSFGFGYPLFNFVFPLPYYASEIFHLIGFSLVDSIKIMFGLSIPMSMVGMYVLARKFTTPLIALAMAILYGYAPYRALDLYIRGAFGEIIALVFLPWLMWMVCSITDHTISEIRRRKIAFVGGLLMCGFILSHNITAYMFLPWLMVLAVLLTILNRKDWRSDLNNLGIAVGLGLFGSSYFWVPALVESKLMKYDTVFNFIDHFPTLRQLITPYWGYGASVPGPYDGMSFFLGYSNLVVILCGLIAIVLRWKNLNSRLRILLGWSVVVFFWSIFMMNFRSSWVWELIPMIAQFQFPWRFLILVSFVIPLLMFGIGSEKKTHIFAVGIIFITIYLNFPYFRPQDFLGRNDDYYIRKYLAYPDVDALYLTQSEEYLRLPIFTDVRPNRVYANFFETEGVNNVVSMNRLTFEADIKSDVAQRLSVSKYMFPGWEVYLNGGKIEPYAGKPFGQITFDVPSGDNKIKVRFQESGFRLFFDVISIAALLGMLWGWIITSLNLKKELK